MNAGKHVYMGPTVAEAARSRLHQIKCEIQSLVAEKHRVERRLNEYLESSLLESERLATQAESFQATQLKEQS